MYRYTPLKDPIRQIRLLTFLPSSTDTRFECALRTYHRDLDPEEQPAGGCEPAPAYSAISYAWGDHATSKTVYIDSLSLSITENCCYVLWQLWQLSKQYQGPVWTNVFWIDAICIDQSHEAEKSCRVAAMSRIFVGAKEVLACVGAHADGSEMVMTMLERTASYFELGGQRARGPTWGSWGDIVVGVVNEGDKLARLPSTTALGRPSKAYTALAAGSYWSCLWSLMEWRGSIVEPVNEYDALHRLSRAYTAFAMRAYWHRLWIVQELALARQLFVVCGPAVVFEDGGLMRDSAILKREYTGPEDDELLTGMHNALECRQEQARC